ncbi:hypothetical protein M3Y96_00904200 [Aphelenchoides besseyi]|nr:hypothetical protein M3Y96_00904200 [Aphelenchoides besseyi]
MSRLRCDSRRVNFVFYIPRRLLIYITIFFVILYTSTAQRLRWCEYLNMLGVVSEECMPDDSSLEKARQVEKQLQYPEYNLCQGRYSMCSKTDECESGVICSQSFTNVKCCTSPYSDCPTVDELGYSCRKRHPTNWCLQDSDCSAGYINRYRCCPTETKRLPATDCPSPTTLQFRCRTANTKTICRSISDCPQRGFGTTRCCATPCGFNLCLARHRNNNTYVIG